jgi:peptidoglycan/LPS O-acetylase OafA/YrhL
MNYKTPASSDRNAAIDSLRGYAALAVLIFHAREILWVGISEWLSTGQISRGSIDVVLGCLSVPFRFGWWGVPLFFVISGYCIHRPEVRRRGSNTKLHLGLGKYAAKRAWRIYPTLVATLLLTAGLDNLTRKITPSSVNDSFSCFVANLVALQNVVAPTYGSNSPLWTLAIEIHFYIVYPIYFASIGRIGVIASTAIIFGISACSWYWLESSRSQLIIFLPYWFSWVVGAYIAEAEVGMVGFPRRTLALLSIPCLILGMSFDRWKGFFVSSTPIVYNVLAIPFALLVWSAIRSPGNRIWSNPISRVVSKIGLFSYSLYATHVPVLIAYRALIQGGDKSASFFVVIIGATVALIVGYFIFLLVEQWTLTLPAPRPRPGAAEA